MTLATTRIDRIVHGVEWTRTWFVSANWRQWYSSRVPTDLLRRRLRRLAVVHCRAIDSVATIGGCWIPRNSVNNSRVVTMVDCTIIDWMLRRQCWWWMLAKSKHPTNNCSHRLMSNETTIDHLVVAAAAVAVVEDVAAVVDNDDNNARHHRRRRRRRCCFYFLRFYPMGTTRIVDRSLRAGPRPKHSFCCFLLLVVDVFVACAN